MDRKYRRDGDDDGGVSKRRCGAAKSHWQAQPHCAGSATCDRFDNSYACIPAADIHPGARLTRTRIVGWVEPLRNPINHIPKQFILRPMGLMGFGKRVKTRFTLPILRSASSRVTQASRESKEAIREICVQAAALGSKPHGGAGIPATSGSCQLNERI